jgi:hypothetical protein
MSFRASDIEIGKLVELLSRDVSWTIPERHRSLAPTTIEEVREGWDWMEDADISRLIEKVVEDVQQEFMDTFVDTTWPSCPRHPNHPLWLHDGRWYCERDGEALAALGGLKEILPALPPEEPKAPGPFRRIRKSE